MHSVRISIIRVDPAAASLMLNDSHRSILIVLEESLVPGGRVKDVCIMREMVTLDRIIAKDVKDKFNDYRTFALKIRRTTTCFFQPHDIVPNIHTEHIGIQIWITLHHG